ncbi:GAF domain-containing protein [Spirulina subsalsa FACHB-351]|uniref:GAF domain-containing protein n=1 Tax=Spirulina subsalsa FACHB-351 TaxID=234711 RepID=A0ABT3L0Z8_9CYAN|nr:adenylate/guanylate cyclase domain-containing protein [Spirulina subsalsa]MCW6035160.1 GAF domain-containing protein [Spirulina subsalsa FACHB-351]
MPLSNTGSILASLTQFTQLNRTTVLTDRVKNLSIAEFICLLDFITAEFQQFLRAIDMINNEALETMLEQVMDAFTLKIGQILQADRTIIFLLDSTKGQLWGKINQQGDSEAKDIRLPLNVGIAGYVAATGELLNIQDTKDHPLFNIDIDGIPNYPIQNVLCMPILSSTQQVVAVVELLNKSGEVPFDAEDEERFRDFASSIGIILETCQSFYMAARNQRGAAALLRATSSLGQSLDLEATLKSVMEQARRLMKADRSTLFMLSREKGELWSKIAKADGKTMMEIRLPANRGIAGYVATTGKTVNIADAYKDSRFDPSTDKRTGYRTQSILCMPVFNSSGELIAVTQLINKENGGSFSSSDEEFMQAFNIQAGIALENAKLFETVLTEKQYQKDILESLSDAVISTDFMGRIFTINDAALELLGCPEEQIRDPKIRQLWEYKLLGRHVWDVLPVDNIHFRLQDSLATGARHYVPEQTLKVGIAHKRPGDTSILPCILAIPSPDNPKVYIPWNETPCPREQLLDEEQDEIVPIERSVNLTVNPLTNPEGEVRGGLVVLEDISNEKRIKSTLYRYMTPSVAEQVIALGEQSMMVGERKDVSILFSDIRGYTTMTENVEATEVVALLNQYFETMVEAVFNYQGTLDKFIGDALMAVFGAPLPLAENHAWLAVQSALDMRHRLAEFNQKCVFENQPQIRFGIGISSGEVVSGNIGSNKRMDYTVIGDAVNLSSRLESLTKEYACDIIISEYTYDSCGGAARLLTRELDKTRVKGKSRAVRIYELIGLKPAYLDPQTEHFLNIYHQGREAYLARDFQRALRLFTEAASLRPQDHPTEIHIQRCQLYLKTPPPESWDGIHIMTTK